MDIYKNLQNLFIVPQLFSDLMSKLLWFRWFKIVAYDLCDLHFRFADLCQQFLICSDL